jgi:dTDP-4-amino-4,6-dideoxygalactose transaminase
MPKTAIDLLKDMHDRSHGIMTGSGTSALVLSLWALGLHGKRVVIPNGVCYSVPLAVILSGNEPVYLDIDRETLSLGVAQLRKYRCWYDAVIAVHNYGARCDIEGIAAFCAKEGLPLVEDCCVALGCPDIGHWGDASVFSFGSGKIVYAGGGGMILADDKSLVENVWSLQQVLPKRGGDSYLSNYHTYLYNQYYGKDKGRLAVFGAVARTFGQSLLHRPIWGSEFGILIDLLQGLRDSIDERWCKWENLRRRLHDYGEPFIHKQGVDWRFNIFIDEGRDDLLRHLHATGYHASSWHAPADLFFGQRNGAGRWPVTDWVADHVLNLWVDHTVGDEYIEGVSREIVQFVEERRQ